MSIEAGEIVTQRGGCKRLLPESLFHFLDKILPGQEIASCDEQHVQVIEAPMQESSEQPRLTVFDNPVDTPRFDEKEGKYYLVMPAVNRGPDTDKHLYRTYFETEQEARWNLGVMRVLYENRDQSNEDGGLIEAYFDMFVGSAKYHRIYQGSILPNYLVNGKMNEWYRGSVGHIFWAMQELGYEIDTVDFDNEYTRSDIINIVTTYSLIFLNNRRDFGERVRSDTLLDGRFNPEFVHPQFSAAVEAYRIKSRDMFN